MGGWQMAITTKDGSPATTREEAIAVCGPLGATPTEPIEAADGVWLVELPAPLERRMLRRGFVATSGPNGGIEGERP